ncbi:MAG: hypothetical protein HY867_20750 [Chloroflexi bacterium]|nr:hypothetical protein [Chloroflexota bacterium]
MKLATISTSQHKSVPALFQDGLYYPLPYPDMRAVIEAAPLRVPPNF